MNVLEGFSVATDAAVAVAEATAGWTDPDFVLVFSSPARPLADVATAFSARFPAAQIVGCTTAGEHVAGRHFNGGLVALGIQTPKMRWATALLGQLGTADAAQVRTCVDGLLAQLGAHREELDPDRYVCLILVDGLSGREEAVLPLVADALDGITLFGGSAGDDLKFVRTEVMLGAHAASDAAVLALCRCDLPFEVIQHQHFRRTGRLLAITRADPASRRVLELDGVPAVEAYARALGIPPESLTADATFSHPLAFEFQNQLFIRSVRAVEPDGSISFFCAIEEGMVVDVADCDPIVDALRDAVRRGPGRLAIGANCILRAVEAERRALVPDIAEAMSGLAHHTISFDTYGEQVNGLHINQTLVALVVRDDEEAA